MYIINFADKIHVHFIGIGGISMSALAEILLSKGFNVSGSDIRQSKLTDKLCDSGTRISFGHKAENIDKTIDLVVYTAAVKEDNPEMIAAKELNIPIIPRAELLGQIMRNFKNAIGVAGTHGKTTTTSMLSQILISNNSDPTALVGGMLKTIEGNIRMGHSENFITEACEYTNSFLSFHPTIAIILNICADHLDFFKDINEIRKSFKDYARLLPSNGTLVINSDIEDVDFITEGLEASVITVGSDPSKSNYSAANITYDNLANASFDLIINGQPSERITLKVPGLHNVYNSLAAIAAAQSLNVSLSTIKDALLLYEGCDRRFQYKGTVGGITIIDDYAHHPDEIKVTLDAAKNYPHKNIWCVFQPHTFSRTAALLKEFASSLSKADKIVLADIYAAREKNTLNISSKDLQNELVNLGKEVYYFPSFDEIENFLLQNCMNGDLLITMGAGDIVLVGERLLGK